jgi:hypothetical protein
LPVIWFLKPNHAKQSKLCAIKTCVYGFKNQITGPKLAARVKANDQSGARHPRTCFRLLPFQ